VAYIVNYERSLRDYIRIVTTAVPWYVAIYTGWVVYLAYLKERYTRFLLKLLSSKKNWGKVRGVYLLHGNKPIAILTQGGTREEILEEVKKHTEDFTAGKAQVLLSTLGPMKLAVEVDGTVKSDLRVKMRDALRAVKIAYPKKFESGDYNRGEVEEIRNILRRYLLAEKVF
jgi:hypothetical protein